MSLEIKVPNVGESISEVTIATWLKAEGEYVEMDEVICELESDKATFELTAEAAGKLHHKAEEGDTLAIGDIICEIDTEASGGGSGTEKKESKPSSSTSDSSSKSSGGPSKTGEVLEMKVPEVGESITEVTIASWLKSDGDYAALDEIIAEIESDKATFELAAEKAGFIQIIAQEGETLEIGAPICKIEVTEGEPSGDGGGSGSNSESGSGGETASGSSDSETYATGHASPAAAKILKEKGIDPKDIKGTGVDGRVTKADAEAAEKKASAPSPSKASTASSSQAEPPKASGERGQKREKMTNLRKTISRRLVSVKNETAMLTTFNEVDMKPIMDLRSKYKDMFKEKHEVGLGFMSFFTKAVCVALKEFPAINAMIDGEEIVYHDYCDISIAVSSPRGLVVPVIRNAEDLSFKGVESEVVRLAKKARDNKLSMDEMQGGTFTITNGGIFGSMLSTPIINAPQSAILGMHNIVERPIALNGEVVIRPIMYLALSYDHRIVDGKESVSFLVRVKQLLEDPARLLLEV
ncbi:MAG: 2-oxoglutarate dehydrogenase complex dihydrolipoyllysine-residue succinyltransferase [Cyclobacteriaceae bacterium]|nr:2-oxoglutarate dehydrogenase complex dihydrolipoyllysine-residue succinyltransferase [Cyclobacteriaceae bacterium]MCH8517334.1 2-oxoglutarate dehydrogenase complex dihydrolipoyllysine-residue succinyltransferase [Cyclobacteriaceae bacterium]